jgi:chitinase
MTFRRTFISVFVLFTTLNSTYARDHKKWITAYYPLWAVPQMYPEKVDFSKVTHIVHFSANPVKVAPFLDVLVTKQDSFNIQYGGVYNGNDMNKPWYTTDIQKNLIERAHNAKAKVLLSVGGIYGTGAENMAWIASDGKRTEQFVVSACAYAKRKKYDGIELDWEFPKADQRDDFSRLMMTFRRELDKWNPKGEFITAVIEYPGRRYDKDSLVAACDQINLMTYGMYVGDYSEKKTGYNTPIEISTEFNGYCGNALNQKGHGPKQWIKEGYPADKIGLGISFLATIFHKVDPPVQPGQRYGWTNWYYIKDLPKEGRHWDASSSVPWQASETELVTYEDTMSVRAKVEYAKSLELGGIMIYDLLGGYDSKAEEGKKDVLLQTVKKLFLPSSKE